MQAVADSGSVLLPIDSEHNAIFQCLPTDYGRSAGRNSGVEKLLLSASGGPFRGMSLEQMHALLQIRPAPTQTGVWGARYRWIQHSLMNKGSGVD